MQFTDPVSKMQDGRRWGDGRWKMEDGRQMEGEWGEMERYIKMQKIEREETIERW
jgi:hypothetical protein